jgi:hypothetical protein
MTRKLKLSLGLVLLLGLTACGGGGGGGLFAGIASLGTAFVNAFQADRNAQPVDASAVALSVNPSADPFNP